MIQEDAIYARQSIDKIDSISIESQIEYCKYETRGGPCRVYADKGFSGKNTDRPEFQQMLSDIRKGEIKRVICYKLDRCSRSILDFTNMLEEFQKYQVEFVSCTEKFDTSSPMGRAMLNICIVFAQLERETIQQRVADAYHSRSQRGFYMGGRIPYCFRLEPYVLHGKKTSRYAPCPEEAEILMQIYTMYAAPQCSLGDILHHLGSSRIPNSRTKDGQWTKSCLSSILKNPIYVRADLDIYEFFKEQGARLLNAPEDYIGTNGCYLFADQGPKNKVLRLEGHNVVLAPHEGIIPSGLWLRCREKCLNNKQTAKPIKAKNTWLAGKLKCGICGYSMVIRRSGSKHGAKRYFMCSRRLNNIHACEGVGALPAEAIENMVLESLRAKMAALGPLALQTSAAEDPNVRELRIQIAKGQEEIDQLLARLPQASEALMEYINKKLSALDQRLTGWNKALNQRSQVFQDPHKIADAMQHWHKLSNPDKMTVVDAWITAIHAEAGKLSIVWKL